MCAGPSNGKLYTEDDWNDEATIDKFPYHLSKTLAEKLAWDLAEEYRFDLVAINPVMMLGPAVSAYGTSNSIMEVSTCLLPPLDVALRSLILKRTTVIPAPS